MKFAEMTFPLLRQVRSSGAKAGLAINPGTLVEAIERYLGEIDLALCMTVWPASAARRSCRRARSASAACGSCSTGTTRPASWR